MFASACLRDRAARFECHHRSARAIFHIELGENVFDVLADSAGFRAQNHTDLVIAFAPRNPEENFGFARRQVQWRECFHAALIGLRHSMHVCCLS